MHYSFLLISLPLVVLAEVYDPGLRLPVIGKGSSEGEERRW
jgi:hypothetical protein